MYIFFNVLWTLHNTFQRFIGHSTNIFRSVDGVLFLQIVDVERKTAGGFARGVMRIEGFGEHAGKTLKINFQNENLIAKLISGDGTEVRRNCRYVMVKSDFLDHEKCNANLMNLVICI
jgi:hypothetical protein